MRRIWLPIFLVLLTDSCTPTHVSLAQAAPAHAAGVLWPGKRPDGSVLLPNQWSLRPVGRQVELGDFPVNIAVHPRGRYAAVLHCGYSAHEIVIVDLAAAAVVSRTRIHEAFYGLEFSRDGKQLFCSGAGEELIHQFDFAEGKLSNHDRIPLRDAKQRCVPAGLAVDSSGHTLFVANVWGHRVSRVDLEPETRVTDILLGTNVPALASAPVQPSADFDTAAADKRAEATLYEANPADTFPYACRLDERRHRLYVSLWAQAGIAVIDIASGKVIARWPAQDHPCEMALTRSGRYLFVANASRNTVTIFDTDSGKPIETLCAALYPNAPRGSTPNSLALTPDERTLFVANADNNTVAVFDVSSPGKSRSLGFIPVGWYPTSVRVTPDGKQLLVANGKGLGSEPNPHGPQPGKNKTDSSVVQYIARLFHGSLSLIPLPSRKEFERQLAAYTAQAYRCSPLRADAGVTAERPADNPVPLHPTDGSPIKYCIYIIKENRTYDQVLGDMPEGHGDASLCLFPEHVTPNHHALARDFVLLDNFYVDAEVSADGHEWSMGAYATDFVEKMWPMNYGHDKSGKFPYPSEGYFPIAAPAGGYLWDRARDAAVTYRSYGEFVTDALTPAGPAKARVKSLVGHIDPGYRGFDLSYADTNRAARFIGELKRFEVQGEMPRLQIVRLGNDHTHGTTLGFRTPTAYVADNDLALGMVVEAVTHSRFWPQTAIFVLEDDAQNGPDHIDAHRSIAFIISPYVKAGTVDSHMYGTSSMLRTMELILGLKPMSQFDAAARPMYNAFCATPDPRPYQCRPANVNLNAHNLRLSWGSSIPMDFSREDAVDDLVLNEAIWRSVRGNRSIMPTPVRAGFVFAHSEDKD
jgi:YVTN family beta-propeller protein